MVHATHLGYYCYHSAKIIIFIVQEWWTYVCLGPSDPHPNWHLGMRGTQHRAVMWRVWKEGGTGFLYWGANCYEKATAASAEVYRVPFLYLLFNIVFI